jgi:cobalt-zinc-cadmium efflux system membrane fusion protein
MRTTAPLIALIWLTAACSNGPSQPAGTAAASLGATAAIQSDPMAVELSSELRQRVRIGTPEWTTFHSTLTVTARLELDATRTAGIGSPVLGRVISIHVEEGQDVVQGQLLAEIHSTGLNQAQLEFLKALSQKMVAERAVERARRLLAADVIGSAEVQRREAELAQATAELDAARDELLLLGMPPAAIAELERTRQLRSVTQITATKDGTVFRRRVSVGQVVQPADTLFDITDLRQLWVVADVPEQDAGSLRSGQKADIEIPALGAQGASGVLSFVSSFVNPETRTVTVRMNLPNADRRFKPAMLALMHIHGHPQRRLTVPEEAIVREGESEFLFVGQSDDVFRLTPVVSSPAVRNLRSLADESLAGKPVIVAGAFHLNNERRRRNIRGGE